MKNLQALGNWVIIKPIEEKKETNSGIITPDIKKTIVGEGEVLFIDEKDNFKQVYAGEENLKYPMWMLSQFAVKIGNKVLFNKPASDEVEIDGEKLILIKKENVIAIINK